MPSGLTTQSPRREQLSFGSLILPVLCLYPPWRRIIVETLNFEALPPLIHTSDNPDVWTRSSSARSERPRAGIDPFSIEAHSRELDAEKHCLPGDKRRSEIRERRREEEGEIGKWKEAYQRLFEANIRLIDENEDLKEENDELREENEELKEENIGLKGENSGLKEENDELKDGMEELKEEIDELMNYQASASNMGEKLQKLALDIFSRLFDSFIAGYHQPIAPDTGRPYGVLSAIIFISNVISRTLARLTPSNL
ncbi:hypothetical protein BDN72DRAFT_962564 [Pluteus cervinus]|uniref:Uncharacterized protein n=1 Tax=Pluteus cervinus TaxID=181527 RepID=A0ACD3AII6_9AGAR|nr:hypothetical protein BDN72DRAFT_962564 [Pluteus cervinus]